MASGADGFFGGAGRTANWFAAFGAGASGVTLADEGAGGCWAGFAGMA